MAISSKDIDTQSFSVDRKGYSIEEVDIFLERVSKEVGLFNRRLADLEKNNQNVIADAQKDVSKEVEDLKAELSKEQAKVKELETELGKKADDGKAISEALIVAQRSADKIVRDANDQAKKIITDANNKADYIEKDADEQKKKVMNEIEKLEKTRISVHKEYQSMLREIIGKMEKHLSVLEPEEEKKSFDAQDAQSADLGATAKNTPVNMPEQSPAPVVPEQQKDFSGFGDADFGGDKID